MPIKILAIDDSKTMRLAIKITFAAEDAEVTSVSRGSEAVARAKQMGADVILVDVTLAEGEPDGYEVCRALKNDSETAEIPVVLMVSNQTGIDNTSFDDSGAAGYIAKPFDTQELIQKVWETVGEPSTHLAGTPRPSSAAPSTRISVVPPATKPVSTPAPKVAVAPTTPMMPATPPMTKPPAAPAFPRTPPIVPNPPASTSISPPPASPAPASSRDSNSTGASIPIAIPIPFTAASSPTPGILKRLKDAGKLGDGRIDPKVAEALIQLSREVLEEIVWEVVPDLAEEIIKEKVQQQSA